MKSSAASQNSSAAKDAHKPAGVPLLDIARQHAALREQIDAALAKVCDSGRFILGPDCEELEARVAEYCQTSYAVACASGSDALLLALMADDIGTGDEVLLPSYTFFATAGAVWRLGARPVFVDVDPATFNIDPADAERKITPRTRAIIPVHLFGQCADMTAIGRLAERHELLVVEDAAQAIGAEFQGRRAGTLGDIGCFSFYPTKNLGAIGDGGMLTTNDKSLADRLRLLRGHGMQPRYYHQTVGINSRLDTLQAAVLNVKFPHLDRWTNQRGANAQRYGKLIGDAGLTQLVGLPTALPGLRHVWNQYVIRVTSGRRDALREHLTRAGIGTEVYYPVPLHRQECFKALDYQEGSLPVSERAALETVALPIFPELTAAEQEIVVARIAEFLLPLAGHMPKPHLPAGNLSGSGNLGASVRDSPEGNRSTSALH